MNNLLIKEMLLKRKSGKDDLAQDLSLYMQLTVFFLRIKLIGHT